MRERESVCVCVCERERWREREREKEREREREIEQFREGVTKKWMSLQITLKVLTENPFANKKPPFPIEMWNQYNAARERVAQSTNNVKGWHYIMQMYFSGSRLKIWLPLQNLEEDSKI